MTDVDHAPATGHRILPHTADLIIEAWAPKRDECLAEAVVALRAGFVEIADHVSTRRRHFTLTSTSDDDLLVALLEEALYVLDAYAEVPTDTHLQPQADGDVAGWFDVADVADVVLVGSIPKGIARSGLSLFEADGEWRCTATVDV